MRSQGPRERGDPKNSARLKSIARFQLESEPNGSSVINVALPFDDGDDFVPFSTTALHVGSIDPEYETAYVTPAE